MEREKDRLPIVDQWQSCASSASSTLMAIHILPDSTAGSGKTILWYVGFVCFRDRNSCYWPARPSSRTSERCEKMDRPWSPTTTLTLKTPLSAISVACWHPSCPNSVITQIVSGRYFTSCTKRPATGSNDRKLPLLKNDSKLWSNFQDNLRFL